MKQNIRMKIVSLALLCVAAQFSSPVKAQQADSEKTSQTSIESKFISNARQLTFEGRRAGEGYFNADGSAMVFQSERTPGNPFFQIFVLDFETGDIEPVSPGHGKTTCAWIHPDGQRVLFASTHADPEARKKQKEEIEIRESGKERRYSWDYDETYEIFEFDRTQKTYKQLTNAVGYDAEGSYSPDGKLVAFASNRNAYSSPMTEEQKKAFEIDPAVMMDIFIMNADGTGIKQLTDVMGYDGGPFFSPDGKKICWRRFAENGASAEIMTMNIDGSEQKRLTRMGAMSWAPFFHPSGEYLIYTTNKHGFGNFELYLVDKNGRNQPVRVTDTKGFDGLASFTPDGKKITWTTNRMANDLGSRVGSQIFLGDWNHELAMKLIAESKPLPAESDSPATDKKLGMADSETSEAIATGKGTAKQTDSGFDARDIMRHVDYLCRKELGGRMTGSRGERKATAYVAAYMDSLGLKPAGDNGTWFQEFEFPNGAELGSKNQLSYRMVGENTRVVDGFKVNETWRPLSFSGNVSLDGAPVVFAGYGIVAPEKGEFPAYDSFANLDVKDKWVLVYRFVPESVTPEHRQHFQFYGNLRKKVFHARKNGAKGLIVMSGPNSQVRNQLVPMQNDFSPNGSSIAAISVTDAVAVEWLKAAGKDIKELQTSLDGGEQAEGFEIKGLDVSANVSVKKIVGKGRNVVGRLQANETPLPTAVLVGAHIDHLGAGKTGSSLARDNEQGAIHFGADDNASGVAAMLEVAEYLSNQKRKGKLVMKRDVIFAGWSGEELGLHGSKHFVESLQPVGEATNGKLEKQTGAAKGAAQSKSPERTNQEIEFAFEVMDDRNRKLESNLQELRQDRIRLSILLDKYEEQQKLYESKEAKFKTRLARIKELISTAENSGGQIVKSGKTYSTDEIQASASKLLKEYESTKEQHELIALKRDAEQSRMRILEAKESEGRKKLRRAVETQAELMKQHKVLAEIRNMSASPHETSAQIEARIRAKELESEKNVASLLEAIDEMIDDNETKTAASPKQDSPQDGKTGDASFHDFKIIVMANGRMTLNGKPTSLEQLKPDLKFIGQSAPDFHVAIQSTPENKTTEQLSKLCREMNVKHSVEFVDGARNDSKSNSVSVAESIVACLNMDMVGRLEEKLVLQGIGSSSYWKSAIESKNAIVGLPITLSDDTDLPTDASSFYTAGVPILSAFTGSHTDYHTPRDTPEKLNYPDAARIARLMGMITRSLVVNDEVPDYLKVESKKKATRGGRRAYLGTVPSYGEDVVGVKLSNATEGGPAADAGVLGGDIIVELAGQKIENIYDYTAVLDGLKIGQETTIVVKRGEKRLELKIMPGSRQ